MLVSNGSKRDAVTQSGSTKVKRDTALQGWTDHGVLVNKTLPGARLMSHGYNGSVMPDRLSYVNHGTFKTVMTILAFGFIFTLFIVALTVTLTACFVAVWTCIHKTY